ncbi:propionyl-CoA synthetase [Elstera cyanobacteriorum]|uniref:propionyl-CoA synthetase n=1 Tax=Elstera cyanobacteriorum TaxID=2022747 RepID=UPI002354F997|nr:propionyl-CoA synthetase [Elstera cyanobacteriorum]MCK6443980.1 propionyl-CoA synthetase [Elstera cyanobacteriorum]
MGYQQVYDQAWNDPEAFWGQAAQAADWFSPWTQVLDRDASPGGRWFVGATTNVCHNALDRHVAAGRGDQTALIYDSAMTGTVEHYTYADLTEKVAKLAGALAALGVGKGDRVLVYMPMIPEAAMAMLACARLGAVHSVVFGGFAATELKTRIEDAKPKVILSASCGLEPGRTIAYKPLLDAALAMSAHKPACVLVHQRPQLIAPLDPARDTDWAAAVAAADPAPCTPVEATDPLYVLYTSGTTGVPKGVVRDSGGYMVALLWSLKNIYGLTPGEVMFTASDVGWVVGHSYIVYGPLLYGATTVLYEGKPVGTPDAGAFWRIIQQHKVSVLFTAPTAFRAIKRDDPTGALMGDYDLSSFRALFLAGERCDPDTLHWAQDRVKVPVVDHWWQTETGWPVAANCLGLEPKPVKPGSPTTAVPGWKVDVLNAEGQPLPAGEIGALALKLPLPPGALPTLWENDAGFRKSYLADYPGYYKTGDAGFVDDEGYVFVMSRIDDIINVAGHRLSTGGMEEVLAAHPDVAECAVIGVADDLKGQVPLGLLVLKAGVSRPAAEIEKEAVALVRDKIGPVAAFKTALVVPRLPKTRSGKILRGTMQKIADGQEYKMPATIDDPGALEDISDKLQTVGYAQSGAGAAS